jgi:hypothetical protein
MYIQKGRLWGAISLSWGLSIVCVKSGPLRRISKEVSLPSNYCPWRIVWTLSSIERCCLLPKGEDVGGESSILFQW